MTRLIGTPRAAGVWGLVFIALLFVSAAMVTVPTAAESGARIATYYQAHGSVIVLQQIVGLFALAAFIAFALSLNPNRWLRPALWFFVLTELATNLVPLLIVADNPTPDTAHKLTLVEDVADALFSLSIALFVAAATLTEPLWLRLVAYVVVALSVVRAFGGLVGLTALDAIAPLAFVAFILVFSIRILVIRSSVPASQPAR